MSKCSARISTSLPLPSSPHWEPNTPETWLSDSIWLGNSLAVTANEDGAAPAFVLDSKETTSLLRRRWRVGLKRAHLGTVIGPAWLTFTEEIFMLRSSWAKELSEKVCNRERERERENKWALESDRATAWDIILIFVVGDREQSHPLDTLQKS